MKTSNVSNVCALPMAAEAASPVRRPRPPPQKCCPNDHLILAIVPHMRQMLCPRSARQLKNKCGLAEADAVQPSLGLAGAPLLRSHGIEREMMIGGTPTAFFKAGENHTR